MKILKMDENGIKWLKKMELKSRCHVDKKDVMGDQRHLKHKKNSVCHDCLWSWMKKPLSEETGSLYKLWMFLVSSVWGLRHLSPTKMSGCMVSATGMHWGADSFYKTLRRKQSCQSCEITEQRGSCAKSAETYEL